MDPDPDSAHFSTCFQDLGGCTYLVEGFLKERLATLRTYHSGSARARQER